MLSFQTRPGKAKSGCLGCVGFLVVVAVVLFILGAFAFRIPQERGLVSNAAEEHLLPTPNREASLAIKNAAERSGLPVAGVDLYVLPLKNTDESILYASLDASSGFDIQSVANSIDDLAAKGSVFLQNAEIKKNNITQISTEYKSNNGSRMFVLTASTDTLRAAANKSITREEFIAGLEADANIPQLISFIQSFR